ncbi:MAG: tetratricopeptide repeat protein, partial [Cyanobacteriota bacterium]
IPGYNDAFAVEVTKALRQWKQDTKGMVDFSIVKDKNQADIIVSWAQKIRKEDYFDQAQGHSYVWGITHLGNPTNIVLSTTHPLNSSQPLNEQNIYMISLHEIGHSLGLWWHTRDPQDIMYPDFIIPSRTSKGARIILNQNKGSLSKRDISNIIALYNRNDTLVLNNLPRGKAIELLLQNNSIIGAVETTGSAAASVATKTNKLNIDLGKSLAYLKEHPDSYEAYNNIGLVYLENNDYDNAVKYLNKAISINSDYAKAYFNLGLAYSKLNNFGMAISNYEKYLNLEPDAPNTDVVEKEIQRLKQLTFNN